MAAVVLLLFTGAGDQVLQQVRLKDGGVNTAGSDFQRTYAAQVAWDEIQARPISGVGFAVIADAHDIYLELLAAGGAITLAALLKGEKFDLVVQKATELGVYKIVPLMTRYADIKLRDAADAEKRVVRWQRIALEAAKQSGRALVPTVDSPEELRSVIDPLNPCFLFSEKEGHGLKQIETDKVTAIIGSEGGWADEELAQARAAGAQIVTLGGRVLRAETAAITATALLQHRFGDLN
jgi:hypothetical protein